MRRVTTVLVAALALLAVAGVHAATERVGGVGRVDDDAVLAQGVGSLAQQPALRVRGVNMYPSGHDGEPGDILRGVDPLPA